MEQSSNKVWYWVGGIIVVLLIIYFAVGTGGRPDFAGATVKIGLIAPLSGDAAAYGEEIERVVNYQLPRINAAMGENGPKFEFVFEDGKCNGNDAVSAFQKLTNIDGVKIILGGVCSSETLGMAPLAGENKILVVSAASSNPTIEDQNDYVFSLSYSDKKVGEDLAKEMSAYQRVAVITEQNDYNIGIRDTFLDAIASYPSVRVVANETFPKGNADFRSLLEKMRGANPQAILLNPNVGVTAENLLRQLAEMKSWAGYKLYSQFAYLSDPARAVAGDFTEGMIIIDAPNIGSESFLSVKNEIVNTQGTLDNLGNYYTASILDAMNILTTLIAENGYDADKVRAALASGSFNGYLGKIEFKGNNFVRLTVGGKYRVEGGRAVFVEEN